MRAWLTLTVPELLARGAESLAAELAFAQTARHAAVEMGQRTAWTDMLRALQQALGAAPAAGWTLLVEYDLLRLHKRIDAVLLTDRATLAIEWKNRETAARPADLRQIEDYALDLHDFHAGCRGHPVVPVLVATDMLPTLFSPPLIWQGVAPPLAVNQWQLGARLGEIVAAMGEPAVPLDAAAWLGAPYRPVPSVLEAAAMLFDRHRSAAMTSARADAANLTRTTEAVARAIATARAQRQHVVVFVTGIPGAGKTLCGLNIVFGALRETGAAFLTGNAPLVAVLRADLHRRGDDQRGLARTALQNVHRFLEHHVLRPQETPEARVIVFDEAQRAWDADQATRDTQRRVSRLTLSEPAHTLDIMARHEDWSVVVALIGNGQEINTGEAGLAEWGRVIAARQEWRAFAAPRAITAPEAAQRLSDGAAPWLTLDDALDLTVPMRSVRDPQGAPWVDALLRNEEALARRIAREAAGVPFFVTRDLAAMRAALRDLARGERRAGLVASSGARRLRAEGLGVQVPAVENWFLDRWPDVRASDALETLATEYDCQGLELDVVGLCWGGDLLRAPSGWQIRRFSGTRWNKVQKPEAQSHFINKYRVLLTRARYETVIWVPPGSPTDDPFHDPTRPAAEMDAIADFLLACGAQPLATAPLPEQSAAPQLL
ncbi:DNA/RNA helicase domain-containing protein [Sediminicoccus sp. KRV36]|uniref:DNA/RNA helicase domain-containing protein n=1 Tax=Sediminicoccus sp. KRV36 TaxID=3133721 RepID=UPI00200FE2A7|nr:DNA/RNA helicase domain-containing protein [Sediminicoccus rosea]UPY38132.1 DUF2075 domain-containing protein [Sediminicoccus rosea]